jgi:hypothetical protein
MTPVSAAQKTIRNLALFQIFAALAPRSDMMASQIIPLYALTQDMAFLVGKRPQFNRVLMRC